MILIQVARVDHETVVRDDKHMGSSLHGFGEGALHRRHVEQSGKIEILRVRQQTAVPWMLRVIAELREHRHALTDIRESLIAADPASCEGTGGAASRGVPPSSSTGAPN